MKVAYIAVRGSALRRTLHNTHDMPYLFNGKERDEETGLYYYGARHIDAELCLWYGVDPLWMKYPDISPYVYCADNPIKFIDPNGAEFDDIVNSIKSGWEKVGQFGNKADQAVKKQLQKFSALHLVRVLRLTIRTSK